MVNRQPRACWRNIAIAQFPEIASKVWTRRHDDATMLVKKLTTRLEEKKTLKGELLRAKLRGEVS
jgi:hypothetical protein